MIPFEKGVFVQLLQNSIMSIQLQRPHCTSSCFNEIDAFFPLKASTNKHRLVTPHAAVDNTWSISYYSKFSKQSWQQGGVNKCLFQRERHVISDGYSLPDKYTVKLTRFFHAVAIVICNEQKIKHMPMMQFVLGFLGHCANIRYSISALFCLSCITINNCITQIAKVCAAYISKDLLLF